MTTQPLVAKSHLNSWSLKISHCKLLVTCAAVTLLTVLLLLYSRIMLSPERAVWWKVHDVVGQSPATAVPENLLEVKELLPDVISRVAESPSPDPITSITKVPQPVQETHESHVVAESPSPDPIISPITKVTQSALGSSVVAESPSPDPITPVVTKVPQPVQGSRVVAKSTSPDPIIFAITKLPEPAHGTRVVVESQSPGPVTLAVTETAQPISTRRSIVKPPTQRPCPMEGAVTVHEGARLGNNIWQYAMTWATSHMTGFPGFLPDNLHRNLNKIFGNLSVPSIDEISHCHINWSNSVDSPYRWSLQRQNIVLPPYPFDVTLAMHWVDDLRKELTFCDELVHASQETLHGIGRSGIATTYVSVHVRRTDYAHYLWVRGKAHPADENFFLRAMAYFKHKYGDGVVFVVASDEPRWCQMKLATGRDDVFVVGGTGLTTPEHDLAVLAACNHSILDYGTFGVWGAIMAKGETVVFNCSMFLETAMIVVKLFDNWRIMD